MGETTQPGRSDAGHDTPLVGPPPPCPPGYEIVAEVGRGGMGVVYRARDLALGREVAVKMLQGRFAPASAAAARFLDEARITGQLQHPGIPAVYQVGALPDGRPFLAMKLIKGRTLDDLLGAGAPVDALGVFGAAAQAVGYAHAHGVIHRDLKPSNVMVGGFGEVQVMDWGLAKVLAGGGRPAPAGGDPEANTPPTEIKTLRDAEAPFTQAGSVLGTPAYMAPEQAAGESDKIDTRSDVFGLGAVLCVLLTGKPPFGGKDAEAVRLAAVRGKTDAAFARLDDCGADPGVVALCKRCLAFEPADRPATADIVAKEVAGLRRAADDRARQAERERLAAEVRAAEHGKRRRVVQWYGAAAAAVLLLGVTGTTIGLVRADHRRREADTARQGTEAAQRETVEALRKLTDGVMEGRLRRAAALTDDERQFLHGVQALWESVTSARGDTPEARALRAEGAYRVSAVRFQLGDRATEDGFRAAVALSERLAAEFPDNPDYLRRLADTRLYLGVVLSGDGRAAEAEEQLRAALGAFERLAAENPTRRDDFRDLALARVKLADHLMESADPGRTAEAEGLYRAALAAYTELAAGAPARLYDRRQLGAVRVNLGRLLYIADRVAEAEGLYRAAVEVYARLDAEYPARPEFQQELAQARNNLGVLLFTHRGSGAEAESRLAEAEKLYLASMPVYEKLVAEYSSRPFHRIDLAGSYVNMGQLTRDRSGRLADSIDWFAKGIDLLAPVHAADPQKVVPREYLRNGHLGRAQALTQLGRHPEALADWDRVVELSPAARRDEFRLYRSVSAVRAGRIDRAVAEAGELSRLAGWGVGPLYTFAYIHAAASDKIPERREEYAARAVELLRRAVAEGYRDDELDADPDFAPLRGRDDFRKLVASLPYSAPPPRPKPEK